MEEDEWDDALLMEIAALETKHLQTHNHENRVEHPSISTAQPDLSTSSCGWNCTLCTLQNEASRVKCCVCATPRSLSHQITSTAPESSKKTVQATLSFNKPSISMTRGPSIQQQPVGRSNSSSFTVKNKAKTLKNNNSQQIIISTGFNLLKLTPRHSAAATGAATGINSASPLSQMPRHATGEDYEAKLRYLGIESPSNFPKIDCVAAQHFVYPANYSIRDYQLTIAEKALYHNTLVSLPTGLGKTLVAAVVMYNFYRWFPTGKIVFMAPTKPLVAQQIKACHEIMGILLSDTAELQGNVPPAMRRMLWNSRRVFFCTPQSLQNDLRRGVCAAEKFVCIVVDEAHRATGNYAYCCAVQEIEAKTKFFRVLALSATPGAKFDVIQDVVTNLRISHIESRSADDPDVKKYTHARQEEVVVCRLGAQIMEMKTQFLKCFTPIVQRLLRGNIIQYNDPEKLTSWYVLQAREKFRKSPSYASNRSAECDLALLVSLLHAKSLLIGHGLRSFCDQITNWVEERKRGKMSWSKREMLQSSDFQSLELSLAVTTSSSSDTASHPKLVKLREVLLEHFQRHAVGTSSTRAIVFTQYRASVSEIVALLRPLAPLLNVQPFIGQGASGKAKENKGQSQKVQQEIVRRFRLGEFNVLVATCIAEEGLDIGEVDLIVSFDALTSPVRMIQRMGRTGRKRVGRVIILVTEGDEQKKLARSASAAKTVSRALTTFKSKFTYSQCPRMLPPGICPQLRELEMKIPTFHASQVGGKAVWRTVDPNLWQLTDAERAVALTKYFPSKFAASSRNKLCPIVANQTHLLRRQPLSLVRKGMGTRVGYSSRSLMLQALVRKIHNIGDVLETDSDDDDGKSDDNRIEMGVTDSSNIALSGSTKQDACGRSPPLDKKCRRIRVGTDNADADGEVGSPRRYVCAHSEFDGEDIFDVSAAAMNESVDLHFSPQFVDLGTQVASAVKEDGKPENTITHRQENQFSASPAAIVGTVLSSTFDLVCPSSARTLTNGSSADSLCRVQMPEGQRINSNDVDNKGSSQQPSAGLSLTRASDSLHPPPSLCENMCLQAPAIPNDTSPDTDVLVASRLRGMRQLHFDEDEVDGSSLDHTQCAETQQQEVIAPAVETDLTPVKLELSPVEDEDHSGFSFALLSTNACTGGDMKDASNDTDQADEDSYACSFALLPPADTEYEGTTRKHSISAKLSDATFHERECQLVDDNTDGDGVDEVNEVKHAVKDELKCKTDTAISVIGLADNGKCHTAAKDEEKTETRESVVEMSESHTVGTNDAIQMPVLSQIDEAKSEQVGEDCCSICLESESCEEDLIVFCDGCNVAVHQFCYGISVVPSGKWFCDICAAKPNQRVCQLCPLHGGAFKQTKCGKWVHVQCFLWIPEFRVEKSDDDVLVLGELSRLDPDRKTLDCSLCHSQKGYGIIQCAHKRCLAAFHVSCAAFADYRMDQLDPPDGEDTGCGTLFLAYCPLHRNSRAPLIFPEQQKTPSSAKTRPPKPPNPTVMEISSPSHLLTSPSSADAKKKFKTFRRLMRKYDAAQSQLFSQVETKGSPSVASPWQKRIGRSKRRRETSRVLAAAYIEDIADVRGGARSDDDDDDDYGDDYKEAADDSFINDSSQLLYSQSVESPEDVDQNKSKKKRKKSSPNMRAIYARSLCESQNSPLLLRPGRRQLGALPRNGIIHACLTKLHNQPNEGDSPPPRPRSRSLVARTAQDILATPSALSTPIHARAAWTESDGDDSASEAEPSPDFNLLGAAKPFAQARTCGQVEQEESDNLNIAEIEAVLPCYNLRGVTSTLAGAANTSSVDANGPSVAQPGCAQPAERLQDARDAELHKKIEVNRIMALEKLEERRQTKLQQAEQPSRPHDAATLLVNNQKEFPLHRVADHGCTSVAASKKAHEDETATHQNPSTTSSQNSPTDGFQRAVTIIDLTSPKTTRLGFIQQSQSPKWVIFVSATFASSSGFSTFLSAKHIDCSVVIDDTLEADALLSVRTAVLFLTGHELHDLTLASPVQNTVKSRQIRMLLAMHKKIVVVAINDGGNLPEVSQWRQLPNATVVVQPRLDSLCAQLHQLARQELVEGYELPSPSLCRPGFSGEICRELDADFASRLAFFRTIEPLSLASALSLSFRFKNFAAEKVPVLKFNEMHWRRMLPWISESTAKEIRKHVNQNMCGT